MEPAHKKNANGHAVRNDDGVFGVVGFLEVAVKCGEKIADAVIDIGTGFAIFNAVVKCAEGIALAVGFGALFKVAQVSPFLFAQTRLFDEMKLSRRKGFNNFFKGHAGAPKR